MDLSTEATLLFVCFSRKGYLLVQLKENEICKTESYSFVVLEI